jgi:hypothetical protein
MDTVGPMLATVMETEKVGNYRSNGNGGNGSKHYCGAGNGGNESGRLTLKQYRYIPKLNQEKGLSAAELDQKFLERYGIVTQYLSKNDASAVIEQLLAG